MRKHSKQNNIHFLRVLHIIYKHIMVNKFVLTEISIRALQALMGYEDMFLEGSIAMVGISTNPIEGLKI